MKNTNAIIQFGRASVTGIGQVMFQESFWTGLLFLAGIFWGSYENHVPQVAWGGLVGVVVATLAGYLLTPKSSDGPAGLYGFNGVLVGVAFPTFLGSSWLMWLALIICAAISTWVRQAFNNLLSGTKVSSFTFPFVFLTWVFLLSARYMNGFTPDELSVPELTTTFVNNLDTSFGSLVIYWLKGISQVFLVNSWVTGIFFIVALAVCSRWAAFWAMAASAISLAVAILFKADPTDIANGLFGFSPVLTGIAVGCTFLKPSWRSALWAIMAIIATVFVQAGMDALFMPYGIATLTGPFCVATWLFLWPQYSSLNAPAKN